MSEHPRSVRNFWIELDIDGRKEVVATGPRGKDGGFVLTIKQRSRGGISKAYVIQGCAFPEGLTTAIYQDGVQIASYDSDRD